MCFNLFHNILIKKNPGYLPVQGDGIVILWKDVLEHLLLLGVHITWTDLALLIHFSVHAS